MREYFIGVALRPEEEELNSTKYVYTTPVIFIYYLINLCQHFFLTFLYLFLFKCWHRLNEPVKDNVIYNQELYVIILLYSIYSVLMYFEIEKKNE